ncbi:hypothetical protein LXL04_001327 [Taraxacum kok-saghyz]
MFFSGKPFCILFLISRSFTSIVTETSVYRFFHHCWSFTLTTVSPPSVGVLLPQTGIPHIQLLFLLNDSGSRTLGSAL